MPWSGMQVAEMAEPVSLTILPIQINFVYPHMLRMGGYRQNHLSRI